MKHKFKLIPILILCIFTTQNTFAQKKKKRSKNNDKEVSYVVRSSQSKMTGERLFFDGLQEKITGNIELAYEKFQQAIKQYPALDAAYYEMAQIEQLGGKTDLAKHSIQKALELSADNIWYNQLYANILASEYNYKAAAAIYKELKEKNPDLYDFTYREAYYYILDNDLKKAIDVYNHLEDELGVQVDISLQKHKLYEELGDNNNAINELKKIIAIDKNDLEIKNKLANFYLSINEETKALETFETILQQDSNNVLALTSLADYYTKKNDKEKALEFSKKAFSNPEISIDVKVGVLYPYIQFFEERKDEIQNAFDLADLLIEAHPNEAKGYSIAGDLRNLNNDSEKALEYYNKSLEKQKDIFTVWQQVFFLYTDLDSMSALAEKTEEAKTYFPNQSLVYFFSGLAQQELKNFEAAEKDYSRGLKLAGTNVSLKTQLYSNLGNVYNDLKEYAKSDEHFDKALELDPNNAYTLNNYSYFLSLRGEKLGKAAEMSLKSNELEPNNSSFLDTYAWVLYKKGDYKGALNYIEQAIEASEETSGTLLEHLGDILYKLNKKDEAIKKWEEAKKLGEGSEFLDKKIKEGKLYE